MRVLIISKSLDSEGGVANFVRILTETLDETAAPVVHFPIGTRKGGPRRLKDRLLLLLRGLKLYLKIRMLKPDIVHLNPSLNFNSLIRDFILLLIIKLARFNQPTLVFFHGWNAATESSIDNNDFIRKIIIFFLKFTDILVVLSANFQKKLLQWGLSADKIALVPTMFEGRLYPDIEKERQFRGEKILFLSRMERSKGVYELLNGFSLALSENANLHLVMAGDGNERKNIIKWIHDHNMEANVSVPGYLRGNKKLSALINSDIFILPTSHPEGLPISLLEAMAAGQVLITTNVGGISEHVKDGYNGFTLATPSPAEIKKALIHCLTHTDICQRIRLNNIRQAWDNYDATKVTKSIQSLYQKAIAH